VKNSEHVVIVGYDRDGQPSTAVWLRETRLRLGVGVLSISVVPRFCLPAAVIDMHALDSVFRACPA